MAHELDLPASQYVPHAGAMLLLERIVAVDEESLVATTSFAAARLFEHDGRIGTWVCLECIAQAVAAWAGFHGRQRGEAPRVGFLLGTSRFECHRPWLTPGEPWRIEVRKTIQLEDGLGQFDGRFEAGGNLVAAARVTVYGPDDPAAVIEGGARGRA